MCEYTRTVKRVLPPPPIRPTAARACPRAARHHTGLHGGGDGHYMGYTTACGPRPHSPARGLRRTGTVGVGRRVHALRRRHRAVSRVRHGRDNNHHHPRRGRPVVDGRTREQRVAGVRGRLGAEGAAREWPQRFPQV